MKRVFALLGLVGILLSGCTVPAKTADIAATTLPVYEFTTQLCQDTGLTVTRLVTENVSCLHDYALNVSQVKAAQAANLVVLSGAGLEDFMGDILEGKNTVDASANIPLLESCHKHNHHEHKHDHEYDAHIWLSPENAKIMVTNICRGLTKQYPEHRNTFESNLAALLTEIDALHNYGKEQLASVSETGIVTFHDGFSYLADCYGLTIVRAIEEESGAEASAAELIDIIGTLQDHQLSCIFVETNGSVSAAGIIAAETGARIFTLDMAMAGDSWFEAMYRNIDTLKEALG
jgi:ABC-type Zn uptake system ZnuABC Zn-binding protein ZnuA